MPGHPLPLPESFGRYRITGHISTGGQAVIYDARHPTLGAVAVKVLACPDDEAAQRIRLECATLWTLEHPNIVRVIDAGTTDDGRPFFAMKRLDGETLQGRLERVGALQTADAAHIAAQVLRGLKAAHAIGIAHRDVKPSNVFLTSNDEVRLIDFGLAKPIRSASAAAITQGGGIVGSPQYVAPEQILGEDIDARTDLYAVGLLLFEMLSGRPPFRGAIETGDHLRAHAHDTAPRLRTLVTVPRSLDALVYSALAKAPADRPQSAEEFARRLERAVAPRRWPRWAAAGVACVGAATAILWRLKQPPDVRAEVAPPPAVSAVAALVAPEPAATPAPTTTDDNPKPEKVVSRDVRRTPKASPHVGHASASASANPFLDLPTNFR